MFLKSDSVSEIRGAIRQWVDMLAEGRFEEAAREVASSQSPWSPSTLMQAIGRYSRKFREAPEGDRREFLPAVTSPRELDVRGENLVLYPKPDNIVVEYDVPISGEWSDLTAKFYVRNGQADGYELTLADIHVL